MSTDDGFDTELHDDGILKGDIIKFTDGKFLLAGQHDVSNAPYVVMALVAAWVKWVEHVPEHRLTPPGARHPDRNALGDLDEEQWGFGLDGVSKKDPWDDTRYLHMVDLRTAADVTFITSSLGGRRAVAQLMNSIRNMRLAHPGALAVIELSSELWKTRFGPRPKPLFRIIDWKSGPGGGRLRVKAPSSPDFRKELDDEIPFE